MTETVTPGPHGPLASVLAVRRGKGRRRRVAASSTGRP